MNNTDCHIYSFDIFDTLLLRPYADPQEVWRVLEEEEKADGFAEARKKADAVTYKRLASKGGETTIEEAYDLIPEWKYLMQKEMDLERKILRVNPETLKWWKDIGNKGYRRIIISDMYLPSDFIKSVLIENGYGDFDAFYLSRDYNARKATGELYKIVLNKEHVTPDQILHIGDNMHSDVKIPASLGIHTQYYHKVIDSLYEQSPHTRKINGRLSGTLALGWHQFRFENSNYTYWNRLGFLVGGVLGYLFVMWIVQVAKKKGKNHLMFVARDGYVWKAICDKLFPEMQTDYFYAPRLTSIAVLGAIGSDPYAIKDRANYLKRHLKDFDFEQIEKDYKSYISKFSIDDNTLLIDGCSSGFSAQRLVEWAVGHDVECLYLSAMADKQNMDALYRTQLYGLQFQPLSEFLFASPEYPIVGVKNDKAYYNKEVSDFEVFKMEVSQEITDASVACAKYLYQERIHISAEKWLEYVNLFMSYLTKEDKCQLDKAKNAADVQQRHFNKITYKPYREYDIVLRGKYCIPNRIELKLKNNLYSFGLSRHGIDFQYKNTTIEITNFTT